MRIGKSVVVTVTIFAMLAAAGVAGAAFDELIFTKGKGRDAGRLVCPGGMSRLGHEFNEEMSLFPFDPAVRVELEYTVAEDFFRVEDIDTGSHAGTHLDVPSHFIEDGRSLDDFAAEEFVWPAYIIDVRGESFADNFVEEADIRDYEREHGKIKRGSLVILQTGAEPFWGAEVVAQDDDDNVANTDDFFDFENAGFSADAVQWLFNARKIDGVGSDAYGPDAFGDEDFGATFTALANDGVALVALDNLDSMSVSGDIIVAPAVNLTDGSGFSVDPLACHGNERDDDNGNNGSNGNGNDQDENGDDQDEDS